MIRDFRPLQIVHDFCFTPIGMKQMNGWDEQASEAEKRRYITSRLSRLKSLGFGGVVINVAFDQYMEDETAWDRFLFAFDEADRLGLRIWIYDEQYYPSGLAGGLTLREHPEWEAQALSCVTRDTDGAQPPVRIQSPYGHGSLKFAFAVPKDEKGALLFSGTMDLSRFQSVGGGLAWQAPKGQSFRVYAFFLRTQYEGSYVCHDLRTASRPPCAMNPAATEYFLRLTLGEYEKRLGKERTEKVEAFFTDEPGLTGYTPWTEGRVPGETPYPSKAILEIPDLKIPIYPFLPWSAAIEKNMENRFSMLPRLFEGQDGQAEQLREEFWRMIPDAVDAGWSRPYHQWAEKMGVQYSGHFRSVRRIEDHPVICGDLLRALGQMHIPGTDRLDSLPETRQQHNDAKLASSAARHYGRKDVMNEISHMYNSKDPLTLPMMCCTAAQQYARGVTVFASYYDEHILPDEGYQAYTGYVAHMGERLDRGDPQAEALVYLPYEQMRRLRPALNGGSEEALVALREETWRIVSQLAQNQVDCDLVNEEILSASRIEGNKIVTPTGFRYARLIFPSVSFLPEKIGQLAAQAAQHHIPVYMTGAQRPVEGLAEGGSLIFGEGFDQKSAVGLRIREDAPSVLHLHKERETEDLELLVQQEHKPIRFSVLLPGESAQVSVWEAETDREYPAAWRQEGGFTLLDVALPPYGAVIITRRRA